MSSIKTLLENLDRIDQTPVKESTVESPAISETLDFTTEWQKFKESYDKEQLDEVLPALAAAGGALARGAAVAGGALAKGAAAAGKGLANVGKQAVQSGSKLAGQAAAGFAQGLASGGGTTPQQQQQQQKQQATGQQASNPELDKQVKSIATNLQSLKSATGANINVPAATTSLAKAVAGQQMNNIDTKNLSGVSGAFQQALTNPSTSKQLVDVVKRATLQK